MRILTSAATALLLAFGLASLAIAATDQPAPTRWTVDPESRPGFPSCGGDDKVCRSITDALAAAAAGDRIDIRPGRYTEAPLTVPADRGGLTIVGAGAGSVTIRSSSASAPVLKVLPPDVSISGVSITTPADGVQALVLMGRAAKIDKVVLTRKDASSADAPVLAVAPSASGTTSVTRSQIYQATGSSTNPAILADAGLAISDSLVISGQGPAVRFTASEDAADNPASLLRVVAHATAANANGVEMLSGANSASAKRLVIDTAIITGGAKGAGLLARTDGGSGPSKAGPITIEVTHLTTAGSANGIVLDASKADAGPFASAAVGSITAIVSNSIVHGPSAVNHFTQVPAITGPSNAARISFDHTDAPAATGNGTIDMGNSAATPDEKLFVDLAKRDLHLRADAPVIDRAAAPLKGESKTDIDGQSRAWPGNDNPGTAARPDMGADEFVNRAPTATLKADARAIPAGHDVTFDASGATDPEADIGGGVVSYRFTFGDGGTAVSDQPTVRHTYGVEGNYQATVTVVDRQGGTSAASAPVAIAVGDGTDPEVAISAPSGRSIVPRLRRLKVLGTASDASSGVRQVELSLRLVKRAAKTKKARKGTAAKCLWFDGTSAYKSRSCNRPLYFSATLNGGAWKYTSPKGLTLPAGTWELGARATDVAGNVSRPVLVRFVIR